MESNRFCLGEKDDNPIVLGPKLKEGNRVFTKDGVRTIHRYVQEGDTEEATKDALLTRSEYLNETNKGKRETMKLQGAYGVRKKQPLINPEDRYTQTGFVKHLTEKDLIMEELQQIREKYWTEYGQMIDDNIVLLAQNYVDTKKKGEKSPLKKTHLMECALLGLTKGPANIKELMHRLDTALEGSTEKIKFRFSDVTSTFTETLRRIVKADPNKNWLRKYLIVDGNGNLHTSKYEFPPPMMKIAAQYPSHMKEGWMVKLPKGSVPFTEEQLLKELPILKKMVITDVPHHGDITDQKSEFDYDIRVRIHENESNRRKLYKDLTDAWMAVDDVTKFQLHVGLMAVSDCPTGMPKIWLDGIMKFIQKHKNHHTYKSIGSGELSIINNKLRAGQLAICKLVLNEGKTSNPSEIGLIPDVASISFSDLRKMTISKGPKKVAEGFTTLAKVCKNNEHIDRYVNPENYKEEQVAETAVVEESANTPLGNIEKEDTVTLPEDGFVESLEIEDVLDEEGTAKPDAMMKLANAVSKIADNGVEVNFNIGFGRPQKKEDESTIDMLQLMNHTNDGLNIVLERMGLLMESVTELIMELKK